MSENRSSGDEDLSNVEVGLNELVAAKVKSYPLAFVFGKSKVTAETIKEYEEAEFSLLVMDALLLRKKSLPLKPMKLLFSGTFSPVDLDFLVTPISLLFWRSFS
jgi:hypothetical protein